MRNTPIAAGTLDLLLNQAFEELDYLRCGWKCDPFNALSHAAASGFGFRYEGLVPTDQSENLVRIFSSCSTKGLSSLGIGEPVPHSALSWPTCSKELIPSGIAGPRRFEWGKGRG